MCVCVCVCVCACASVVDSACVYTQTLKKEMVRYKLSIKQVENKLFYPSVGKSHNQCSYWNTNFVGAFQQGKAEVCTFAFKER